jgi:hypothetical protein
MRYKGYGAGYSQLWNDLFAERDEEPVGKHWVNNFKTRILEI